MALSCSRGRSHQPCEQRKHQAHSRPHGKHLSQRQAAAACRLLQWLPCHAPVHCQPTAWPWLWLPDL